MSGFDDRLLQHFLNPKNVGTIVNYDGYARIENPVNGYTTDIYIQIENGKISDAKFKSMGCTATIATSSAITELIKNINLDDLINLIKHKPDSIELILTGRYAHPRIVAIADIVSEILDIKHPYEKGLPARRGIDF